MAVTSPPARQQGGWSSLPADLLRDILSRLPWSSHPSFAATCTHWRTVVSPFYPAWLTPLLLNAVDVGSSDFRYYSPYHHKIFEVDLVLGTPNAMMCCSSGRHLTLWYREGDDLIVVRVDLVTGVIQTLNPLERHSFDFVVYDDDSHRMFGVVACANMLGVDRSIERDDGDGFRFWEFSELISPDPVFTPSPTTNPVLHHGLLYMLADDGRLAVYDDRQHEQGFKILDKPADPGFLYDDFYLFESDKGDLMAVFMNRRGSELHVTKLNERSMEWENVESLEGRTLFTGTLSTMMVKTDVEWMRNKVILPRLYEWPDVIQCDLVDRDGELAFVPKSAVLSHQDVGATDGNNIWTSGLAPEEATEFWGTANFDYKIWVKFEKLAPSL